MYAVQYDMEHGAERRGERRSSGPSMSPGVERMTEAVSSRSEATLRKGVVTHPRTCPKEKVKCIKKKVLQKKDVQKNNDKKSHQDSVAHLPTKQSQVCVCGLE